MDRPLPIQMVVNPAAPLGNQPVAPATGHVRPPPPPLIHLGPGGQQPGTPAPPAPVSSGTDQLSLATIVEAVRQALNHSSQPGPSSGTATTTGKWVSCVELL